tara:strand:+ start:60 stop:401 length:342 start_codon:yes stop_codon:yes gene_type:complete
VSQCPTTQLTVYKRPNGIKRRKQRLKEVYYDALMRAAMSCKNTLIWPIVDFAIETGMRRSEILSLRWGNVSTAELLEPPSDTKNELKRDAPPTLKETGNSKPPSAKRECIPNL